MDDMDMQEMDSLIDGVASELLEGIEKKDKTMVLEALRALICHINDTSMEQE